MAIDSTSTDAEVWAAYDDNASYEEDASPTKCRAFITACRVILRRRPATASRGTAGGGSQAMSYESIKSELDSARDWLQSHPDTVANGGRAMARFASFEDFRG